MKFVLIFIYVLKLIVCELETTMMKVGATKLGA